jgi:acyl carrier protein
MSINNRVAAVFVKVFQIAPEEFSLDLVPEDLRLWDSVGHMNLVRELEESMGVQLEVDEISEMTSAAKIVEILDGRLT